MRISDFNYSLPDELIAQYPTTERRGSRLLELGAGLTDRKFAELPALLRKGDLLVFNDTRVIPARLQGHKETGGRIEVLIERIETDLSHRLRESGVNISVSGSESAQLDFAERDITELARAAVHYINTETEIERFCDLIAH